MQDRSGYVYENADRITSHDYLPPAVSDILRGKVAEGRERRVFDLGCGNGSVANALTTQGFDVQGIDASKDGIALANKHYPNLKLDLGSAYDDLAARYAKFPFVISLEVVEHLYFPRLFASTAHTLLEDKGIAIVSTPYHGCWKNLALALSGRMDAHFTALWDDGHIMFWSFNTMRTLLEEAGFQRVEFRRVGRVPALAKSMIAIATK